MASTGSNQGFPIPYITAVWSGMSAADIEAGVAAGSILRPARASEGATSAVSFGSVTEGLRAANAEAAANGSAAASTADSAGAGDPTPTADGGTDPRKEVETWLRSLDPSLTEGVFDAVWTRAGATDADRATTLRRYLGETLLGDAGASRSALDDFVADPAHRAQVVDLHGMTGADLARLATEDIGYRHALATMQPLALTGNRALFARANADGALDRFDPDTGEQLVSDAWLGDRAKLLAWTAMDADERSIAGSEDWSFVDRTAIDADGNASTVELATGNAEAGRNQVVFGDDGDEFLQGVSGSDRMYGGDGNDVLRGAGGGDHLEGGRGDDLVLGGAGHDELTGDQGHDELEGGRGDDRLTGGSGNDVLTGGRGNDRLEGGTGVDTYLIDEGDGADVIVDADGAGVIERDGVQIGGTLGATGEGTWASSDGRIEASLSGDADEAGTLTIRMAGEGGVGVAAAADTVTVRNWKNGDLGITLASTPTASSTGEAGYDPSSITGPEVPVLSAEDLAADVATGEAGSAEQADAGADVSADIAWGDVAPVGVGNGASSSASVASEAGSPTAPETVADSPASASDADAVPAGDLVQGSDIGSGIAADSATDPGIGDASTTDATPFDAAFAEALASIFGADPGAFTALEPAHVESALQAFDGVLEAPDIAAAADFAQADAANAVTAYDYADALAGDYAGDDIGNEAWMAMPIVPDVISSETSLAQMRTFGVDR